MVKVLVGATGVIGRRHLKHILDESEAGGSASILIIFSDVDATAPELARNYGVPHFRDIDECADAQADGRSLAQAIILATPTHTHVPQARKLLDIGIGILVEKPVAATGESGRELLATSKGNENSVILVGHHRRHNCYVRAIEKEIQEGKLGKIIAVNGVWAMRKSEEYFKVPWRQQAESGGVVRSTLQF
ncbi:uncharacterized protein A1O9_02414 [Exophiala aquamarina CBS 119918]|uniref:Gfo/Idh/MocA-like oxidoreductase N-terminal domain-containing protein n=1 Tax=Exophiala aquamarina CBS 119918 TaxID=1182545 RepID=A0A072PM99_9EURO|nr:uncharacterized protein A1O9_02414 [Exophiala aquamarina CBS 119918]KEF60852.1 hypothetical protein A1O9_02414 [Exophiala aquamarina CBS 119918]